MLQGTDHIQRDSFQVKLKMNTLKRKYKKISADLQGSHGEASTMWPFYKDVQDIMYQLPASPNSTDVVEVFFDSGADLSASQFAAFADTTSTPVAKRGEF